MANSLASLTDSIALPIILTEITPLNLFEHWPFIKRGLKTIIRRVKPDWRSENVFSALTTGHTNCVLAQRAGKSLGFVVYYKQPRPFSLKPDLFIWGAYDLPLRERTQADNVPEAVATVWRYLGIAAKTNFGTSVIVFNTTPGRAKAFEQKYGWSPTFVSVHVNV